MQVMTQQDGKCQQASLAPTRAAEEAGAPVRVCFLIDELAAAGTELQLLALIRNLNRAQVRPYLCLLRGGNAASRSLEPDDCPVLRLEVSALRSFSAVRAACRFLDYLKRERIDVLQVYFPDSTYFGIPLAWVAGVPTRVRTRNNLGHWLTRGHRLLGRLLNGLTSYTLTNCEAARTALIADEGPQPARVFVLENGVDLDPFAAIAPVRRKALVEPKLVGTVANLRAVKGLDLLIEAATRVLAVYPAVRFRVAGEGEQRAELEALIRRHGLAGKFELAGGIRNIPAFLATLDVAVLCSRAEGMPNALLEYMAAGRPLVATTVGAVEELVAHRVHGLLVPPNDAGALAAAILTLLQKPGFATMLAKAAGERVRERYSREAMIARFERFYRSLPRRHPSGC